MKIEDQSCVEMAGTGEKQGPEDGELVRAARAGDMGAFEALVERYFGMVFALSLARMGTYEAAEDLTQEVFLRIYLNLGKLDHPEYFATWLTRVTRNLATDWLRRGARATRLVPMVALEESEMQIPDTRETGPDGRAVEREQRELVQRELARLPVEVREMLLLHYVEDFSMEEIGRRLEKHPTTVGRQMKKAVSALRGSLGPIMGEARFALRAPKSVAARSVAVIAAAAAMSAASKAALAAAGGTLSVSSVSGGKAGAFAAVTGFMGLTKQLMAAAAVGGQAMGMAKGVVAAVAAVAVLGGGVAYYQSEHAGSGGNGGSSMAGGKLSVSAPPAFFKSGGAIEGNWIGNLDAGKQGVLRIVFRIQREQDKSFSASMDSPDQGISGLPVTEFRIDGDAVSFGVSAVKGSYEGKRTGDSEISGTWKQPGFERAMKLIRTMEVPAVKTPTPRTEITVDPSTFDQYVGQYAITPKFSITITREGDGLYAQATGQQRMQIFPEAENKFFWKVVDAQLTFEKEPGGGVNKVVLHQNNMDLTGTRIK
ncbi:MAG: sigma-70 family RNA polymerase sigma factor [Candidatus Sumerlaeaceae bacterium]|nr:sigma-70 family RNA polymerase sigma factor [Candidatus Sumerlaeaceae bacterium]